MVRQINSFIHQNFNPEHILVYFWKMSDNSSKYSASNEARITQGSAMLTQDDIDDGVYLLIHQVMVWS